MDPVLASMVLERGLRGVLDELVCECDRRAENIMSENPALGRNWLKAGMEVHRALTRLDTLKLDL